MSELDTIFSDDWSEDHRSGMVAVIGRPNVGKSTLINAILKQKVAIVTSTPQTTRKRQLGIVTTEQAQIVFIDTPGMHKPHHKLGNYMVDVAQRALPDADVILWILDGAKPPGRSDQIIAETIAKASRNTPIVMVLNKSDLVKTDKPNFDAHLALIPHHSYRQISALKDEGVQELVEHLISLLPLGPRYYPADQVSEANMRFIASEVVREKIINQTTQEIPHSVAVEVTSYLEEETITKIMAVIYVERDSQKGIIIGKKGSMIKTIGIEARRDLEEMLDIQVHLDLRVKVLKNWRSNEDFMKRLGYQLPKK